MLNWSLNRRTNGKDREPNSGLLKDQLYRIIAKVKSRNGDPTVFEYINKMLDNLKYGKLYDRFKSGSKDCLNFLQGVNSLLRAPFLEVILKHRQSYLDWKAAAINQQGQTDDDIILNLRTRQYSERNADLSTDIPCQTILEAITLEMQMWKYKDEKTQGK